MNNYNIELQTKEIQQYGLQILRVFHDICEANGLKYILDFGTLLGAVRHEGFIPWDDDIDVAMPEKILKNSRRLLIKYCPKICFYKPMKQTQITITIS